MDSPDQGLRSDTPGDPAAGLTDHWFVRPDGQPGTPVEPTSARLEVRRVDDPLGVLVVLRGDLDLATVPLLKEHLDRAMRSGAAVVIDLAGLGFIDSSGLQVLFRADRHLRASDRQLVLPGLSRAVYRVFELAGMDRYFEWSDAPRAQTPELDPELVGRMTS